MNIDGIDATPILRHLLGSIRATDKGELLPLYGAMSVASGG